MTREQATELAENLLAVWPRPRPANEIEHAAAIRAWRDLFVKLPYDVGCDALAELERTRRNRPAPVDLDKVATDIWRRRRPDEVLRPGEQRRPRRPSEPPAPPEIAKAKIAEARERLAEAQEKGPNVVPGGAPRRDENDLDYTDPYEEPA